MCHYNAEQLKYSYCCVSQTWAPRQYTVYTHNRPSTYSLTPQSRTGLLKILDISVQTSLKVEIKYA